MEDYLEEDGTLDKTIFEHVDLGRYLNVPECIKSRRLYYPLPNLKRLTVASWLAHRTNVNEIVESDFWHLEGLPALNVTRQFERLLAGSIHQFTPPFVCHYPCDGFLRQYPSQPGSISINIIHEARVFSYAQYLVLGAQNLVHFEDIYKNALPETWVAQDLCLIASELVEKVNHWLESSAGQGYVECTKVYFVLHRSRDWDYDDMTEEDEKEDEESIKILKEEYKETLAGLRSLPEDWNDDMWDFEWEECEPPCPACCPEWTDNELYACHLDSPAPSIFISPPNTPSSYVIDARQPSIR
jgi:hypothetical protein